ncbi:molybdopterin-binding protein [Rhodobacter calidifons]|uniref:Molybdopterin-binding protein n=1 Tax=Rhodobacter calidifons TaxID=2715277 RepID=A0ABX0G7Y0_9RHOB|nr:molybdopterin-binding protein [Rhodobacter calidifons]NHB77387.1 molybdopterin-binding protein [Rhodobacter calidifons]
MRFGPVPLSEAEGAILAHSVALPEGRLRKGCILGPEEVAQLRSLGRAEVIAARLDPDDLHEDAAALAIAQSLVPEPSRAGLTLSPVGTGRVNVHSAVTGLAEVLADRVIALNAVDPMITLATVPPWQRMAAREMVATVKIIAYGVPRATVEAACAAGHRALRMQPVALSRAALIQTVTDRDDGEKGHRAIQGRLEALNMAMLPKCVVPHREADLAAALTAVSGADLILILTASATSDPQDVAPQAVRRAGGSVERFGMPVDPGNLLFLGRLNGIPVIGLPGCARSPALNGADWVMERVICGVPVTSADIAAMGVGGLLKEIPQRGRLREAK